MMVTVAVALRALAGRVRLAELVGEHVVERGADALELCVEDGALRLLEHCASLSHTLSLNLSNPHTLLVLVLTCSVLFSACEHELSAARADRAGTRLLREVALLRSAHALGAQVARTRQRHLLRLLAR